MVSFPAEHKMYHVTKRHRSDSASPAIRTLSNDKVFSRVKDNFVLSFLKLVRAKHSCDVDFDRGEITIIFSLLSPFIDFAAKWEELAAEFVNNPEPSLPWNHLFDDAEIMHGNIAEIVSNYIICNKAHLLMQGLLARQNLCRFLKGHKGGHVENLGHGLVWLSTWVL
jgi:hypothetical protein